MHRPPACTASLCKPSSKPEQRIRPSHAAHISLCRALHRHKLLPTHILARLQRIHPPALPALGRVQGLAHCTSPYTPLLAVVGARAQRTFSLTRHQRTRQQSTRHAALHTTSAQHQLPWTMHQKRARLAAARHMRIKQAPPSTARTGASSPKNASSASG